MSVSQNTEELLFRRANKAQLKFIAAAQKTVSQIKNENALWVNSHSFQPFLQSLAHKLLNAHKEIMGFIQWGQFKFYA